MSIAPRNQKSETLEDKKETKLSLKLYRLDWQLQAMIWE